MTTSSPTIASALQSVTNDRLYDLAKVFGIQLPGGRQAKASLVGALRKRLLDEDLSRVLEELGRDELRAVCRAHALPSSSRSRDELKRTIIEAAGLEISVVAPESARGGDVPHEGQILAARGRQWLVEEVVRGERRQSPLLRLACLDDDAQGKVIEVLWDLELGARVIAPEAGGMGIPERLDPPSFFGAYLHALKWSAVSAADPKIFQAPFRAGIKLMTHQLTPLMKALELPRANLFIADDVGLGKTIEAGLVLQELILRQQADFVLIVCPAAICLQWRDEMLRRFGLGFEVMSRRFVANRRVQRGFGVNPWSTHNRFIVSHDLLRRPEYREDLLHHLRGRAAKGLLILDEAHVAAPSSGLRYSIDSHTTRTIRDLAPKFDNRLFLSATPHNGHSSSFSALLEILDPVRFDRAAPIERSEQLAPVMVRRLKRDLRRLGIESLPERILVEVTLTHRSRAVSGDDDAAGPLGWRVYEQHSSAETGEIGELEDVASGLPSANEEAPVDLEIARLMARYSELLVATGSSRNGRLTGIRLQKRMLSSPEAFSRSLETHARALDRRRTPGASPADGSTEAPRQQTLEDAQPSLELDPALHGTDDDIGRAEDAELERASQALSPGQEARQVLEKMRALAEHARRVPDAKTVALLDWLRRHCCPAIRIDTTAVAETEASLAWTDRRVLIFTEYIDTKRYLEEILRTAIAGTEGADERIITFVGGMGDDRRDEVQRAFNTPPAKHPVRILIATDAAREGVNLQAHCSDLFHFDVPWNPSRMEQRNGRLDRTLQPAKRVRCHYFIYAQRPEDRVLSTLVKKIGIIQRELGSVGSVLLGEIGAALEDEGIDTRDDRQLRRFETLELDESEARREKQLRAERELEHQRRDQDRLRREIDQAATRLEASEARLRVDPDALRGVVEVGLRLAGAELTAEGLERLSAGSRDAPSFYRLPDLDHSWQRVLDTLRPPRQRDESFGEWRRKTPRPVTFHPVQTLSQESEQLHLAHPLVRRLLDRFLAQGFSADDLTRVTAVVVPDETVRRVIAYARLTLFGPGAARLHDEILSVVAPWTSPANDARAHAPPYAERTAERARERAEAALSESGVGRLPGNRVREEALRDAPTLFAALWPHLEQEADAHRVAATNQLAQRARKESEELVQLLQRQDVALERAGSNLQQLTLPLMSRSRERRQVELDLDHLERRRAQLARQMKEEPAAIEALYQVRRHRLSPVGLVFVHPEAMT